MLERKKTYTKIEATTNYIRDGRAPIPINEVTSKIMSSIRGKNTKPEIELKEALRKAGATGYSSHIKALPGKPDIVYPKNKLAIFINGCFWHQCPYCKPSLPISHKSFWKSKFAANKLRDSAKSAELKAMGWRAMTVWECQWKRAPKRQLMRIIRELEAS
jgi:DNA mismatch endonuclease (patch repair protein)